MDKASDFESEDCEFESRRGQGYFVHPWHSARRFPFNLKFQVENYSLKLVKAHKVITLISPV